MNYVMEKGGPVRQNDYLPYYSCHSVWLLLSPGKKNDKEVMLCCGEWKDRKNPALTFYIFRLPPLPPNFNVVDFKAATFWMWP